jgi:FMN phosphatase YigB (HAD superfamily)
LKPALLTASHQCLPAVATTAPELAAQAGTERRVRGAILWDFDGTVYRAPDACRYYAEEISRCLPPAKRACYLQRVEDYLRGNAGVEAADGWEAAVSAAGGEDDPVHRRDAFRKAREYLESERCPVEVPTGLREALEATRPVCRQLLLSNTPAFGVFGLLQRLGLADLFDEVVCEAGKPGSLPARVAATCNIFGLDVHAVLSVGDHFRNDIAPALGTGAATAYIDQFGNGPAGLATLEAPSLEGLLPAIQSWALALPTTMGHGQESPRGRT